MFYRLEVAYYAVRLYVNVIIVKKTVEDFQKCVILTILCVLEKMAFAKYLDLFMENKWNLYITKMTSLRIMLVPNI